MQRLAIFITAILIAVLCAGSVMATEDPSLSDLDQQIKQKQEQLEKGKKKEKEMMNDIVDLEKTIGDLDAEINNSEQDLETLQKELKEAQEKVNQQNKGLNKRLRNMYKNGSVGFFDVLMNSGSFSEFLTNLDMVQRILKNDEEVLADLKESHDKIEKKKKEVEELQAELNVARQTASDERAEVARQKEALVKENEQTADDIGDLEAERAALEARLAAKSESGEISNSKSSKYEGGAFTWPLPASHKITSEYGWRDCPFHGREFHAAIDIGGADTGSPIVACADGKVVHAGWYGGFGNSVIIDHGGGITTQYNHCSSVCVSEGQKVKRGQTIAKVGSTGFSTGPHLDFRVYVNGNVDNPWSFL